MKYIQDHFYYWIVSGIIAVIIRDIYSFIAKKIGFANFYIWNVGASLMIDRSEISTVWGIVLGLLVDIVVGGLFGVLIGLLIEWRGTKNYIIKGWGMGLITWLFFYGILYHNLPYTKANAPSDALSNISAFVGHSIFGIITALVYIRYFVTSNDRGH